MTKGEDDTEVSRTSALPINHPCFFPYWDNRGQAQGLSGRLYFEDMKLYISTRCRIPDCWGFELGFGCPVIERVQPLDNP